MDNDQNACSAQQTAPTQRMKAPRTVRMSPKVVAWVVFCASLLAIVGFSIMFIHAAYRNHW